MAGFIIRPATLDDLPALQALMHRAINALQNGLLTPEQVEASFEYMGVDTQLIRDGTYVLAWNDGAPIGCGGWSWRRTLFGGDATAGRDESALDPKTEPARIRAMYTDPAHARRGVGRAVLEASEAAALAAGFTRVELMATLSGARLYREAGYAVLEELAIRSARGVETPLLRMGKQLRA